MMTCLRRILGNEANLAQNRPLLRLMSAQHYTLIVVHATIGIVELWLGTAREHMSSYRDTGNYYQSA